MLFIDPVQSGVSAVEHHIRQASAEPGEIQERPDQESEGAYVVVIGNPHVC